MKADARSQRFLLVEDEPPALEELRFRLLEADASIEAETAANAVDAVRLMNQRHYDVVVADIQMPGLSGLELAELIRGLADPPRIVFVTAFEEHAVRAFELGAVDYLMKPVAPDRLRTTLERLRNGHERNGSGRERPGADGQERTLLDKLPVEVATRTVLIDIGEICWADARDDVAYVHTLEHVYPTRFSLNDLQRRLPRPPFLRIHRGVLANMRKVVEITPNFNGTYVITLSDAAKTHLNVSRGRAKDFRMLLGL